MTPPRETEPMTEAIILPEFNPFAIQIALGSVGMLFISLDYCSAITC